MLKFLSSCIRSIACCEVHPTESKETVPGVLYDMLQKEVIASRKARNEKDQSLKDKDDAIDMLAKKVDTLTKAMEVEAKKMRREVSAMEKEVAAIRVEKDMKTGPSDLRRRVTKCFLAGVCLLELK
ncbi:hypothetical protein QQ045_017563 [Rhodiola kirilowii]